MNGGGRWLPGPAPRRERPAVPGWLMAGLVAALALVASGCSQQTISQGPAGVSAQESARVSLVVAQTRAQFPQLSGTAIPFDPRQPPAATPATHPELALRGKGVEMEPGLQTGTSQHVLVALYLDKAAYARGYLELTPAGAPMQRLPIVAYDLRGDAHKRFDFIYVLATPDGALRYLDLVGGPYTEKDTDYLGYEGTLIVPGPGNDLTNWSRAFQLDFGYRLPVVPLHQAKVKQAVTLFQRLQGEMRHLDRLRGQIAETEAEVDTRREHLPAGGQGAAAMAPSAGSAPSGASAAAGQPTSAQVNATREAIARLQAKLDSQRAERKTLLDQTQGHFVSYYGLRQAIATEYARFTQSNRYLWLDTAGKQGFYDQWKVVEYHHPRIDNMVADFLTFRPKDEKVLNARSSAMAVITQQDNWAKDPSRSGQAKPH